MTHDFSGLPMYGLPPMDLGQPAAPEGLQARAGDALPGHVDAADEETVIAALKTVYDPEIPVDIYELGLIYACAMDDNGDVDITMTLTTPACPVAGELPQQVADAVAASEGVGVVKVTLTWEPPWTVDMMSEDARIALDWA